MMFRIQKLLVSEYIDFEEIVLVENPFTEVNLNGIALSQVHMAITGTKLIIAKDIFHRAETESLSNVYYERKDPETESMELVSLIPLEFLDFDFFRRGSRQIMKITLPDCRSVLFEFGGHIFRNLYWNTWRDRIASFRATEPIYYTMEDFSPYSSSDIILDTQTIKAQIHRPPPEPPREINKKNNLLNGPIYRNSGWSFENTPLKNCVRPHRPLNNKFKAIAESFLQTQSESILSMEQQIERVNNNRNLDYEQSYFKSMSNIYESNSYEW